MFSSRPSRFCTKGLKSILSSAVLFFRKVGKSKRIRLSNTFFSSRIITNTPGYQNGFRQVLGNRHSTCFSSYKCVLRSIGPNLVFIGSGFIPKLLCFAPLYLCLIDWLSSDFSSRVYVFLLFYFHLLSATIPSHFHFDKYR